MFSHLRRRLISSFEIFAGQRHQLAIAGMINRFNCGDAFGNLGVMRCEVMHQFSFGVGRAGDENGATARQGVGHLVEVGDIRGLMAAADGVGLVVNMLRGMIRMDDQLFNIIFAEIKNLGFAVINPDDGVKMFGH